MTALSLLPTLSAIAPGDGSSGKFSAMTLHGSMIPIQTLLLKDINDAAEVPATSLLKDKLELL